MITDRDIRTQVDYTLDAQPEELTSSINRGHVVDTIIARHGLVDTDTLDHDEFWAIIAEHDSTRT